MTGEGWVWIGSDGIAASLLHADAETSKAADGMIAVSPKSESISTLNFREKILSIARPRILPKRHFY